jgi:hypothetical protein
MYRAFCDALGATPQTLQLAYPFFEWDWPPDNPGQTDAQEQAFLDALPPWSPVGQYASGASFSVAYATWLRVLNPADPLVRAAQGALADPGYFTQVVNGAGPAPFPAPGYVAIPNYGTWVTENQDGPSTTITWQAGGPSSDLEDTWAGPGVALDESAVSLLVEGQWRPAADALASSGGTLSLTFSPWGRLPVTPLPWYQETIVNARIADPAAYQAGYFPREPPGGSGTWALGAGGILPLRLTDLLVAYRPTFSTTVGTRLSARFRRQIEAAAGVQIGPFVFTGRAGSVADVLAGRSSTEAGLAASAFPVLFGVFIRTFG